MKLQKNRNLESGVVLLCCVHGTKLFCCYKHCRKQVLAVDCVVYQHAVCTVTLLAGYSPCRAGEYKDSRSSAGDRARSSDTRGSVSGGYGAAEN